MESNDPNNLIKSTNLIKSNSKKIVNFYEPSQIFSESIIKSILDKIITMSVIKSHSTKINNKMGEYCFNFVENFLSPLFESSFINHTTFPENKNEPLSWKTKIQPKNSWVEIPEPKFFECDRFEGNSIKYVEISNNSFLNKSIKKGKKPSSLMINKNRTKKIKENPNENSNFNMKNFSKKENEKKETNLNKKFEFNKNSDITNEKVDKTENEQNNNKKTDNDQNNDDLSNAGNKKNKRLEPLDLPSYNIPNILEEYNHDKFNPENVELLRKQIAEELLKQQLEKERLKKLAQKPVFVKTHVEKNNKPFDPSKLTFDPNGKIIPFKQYSKDKLVGDFLLTKLSIKDKKHRDSSIVKNSDKKSKNKKVKLPTPENTSEELIIKNPLDNDIYQSDLSKKLQLTETVEKIIPSGNNFSILLPGIGVVASEEGEIKEGPREFAKYFKKYSLMDYQKMLNDSLPNLNKTFLRDKILNKNIPVIPVKKTSFSSEKNKFNYTDNNMNNTNPLIDNRTTNNFEESNKKLKIKNPIDLKNKTFNISNFNSINQLSENNPLLTTYKNINSNILQSFRTTNNSLNFENSITMRDNIKTSLKIELDSLKDLTENNPNFPQKMRGGETDRKNENILGKQFRNRVILGNKNLNKNDRYKIFMDFNKNILTNRRWGDANLLNTTGGSKERIMFSKHQTKRQVEMELGTRFLNGIKVKLPRNRKININV